MTILWLPVCENVSLSYSVIFQMERSENSKSCDAAFGKSTLGTGRAWYIWV